MADDKPGLLTLGWFEPIYRRVIVIAIIALWSAWEWFFNHDQFWGYATLAMLAYGIWVFFITFDRELAKQKNDKPKS
jgi:hypothetical protein